MTNLISRVKRYLGIASPSLEFLAAGAAACRSPCAPDGSTLPVPVVRLPPDVVIVPAEQCPNCARVETECQCGDLRDCW